MKKTDEDSETLIVKLKQLIKKYKWLIVGLGLLGVVIVVGPTLYAKFSTEHLRYGAADIQAVPKREVALVFGAGVYQDGTPTPYLQWRVETAVALFKAGKVQKLLMSGDNSTKTYDEPVAMKKYAEHLGVPASAITLDYAGFSTYDSCYRANKLFGVDSAILVSQGYHLPRALITCNDLGIKSIGVAATSTGRDYSIPYIAREYISTIKAVFQLVFKPQPTVVGKPQPPLE